MLIIEGNEKQIYEDIKKIKKKFKELENWTGDLDINKAILECFILEIKGYLKSLDIFDNLIATRKILDLGLSRHQYEFRDWGHFYTYVNACLESFHRIGKLCEPNSLSNVDKNIKYQKQNASDPFQTTELYRAVCLREYIEIFVRRELPCSGNYFSPGCPWIIEEDGTEGIMNQNKYEILLKFTLSQPLLDLLNGTTLVREQGDFSQINLKDTKTILYKGHEGEEIRYGIKHEDTVVSFRMGNRRTTGQCHLWELQKAVQNISIEKVVLSGRINPIYMDGTVGLTPYHLRFTEIDDYLSLLNEHFTFGNQKPILIPTNL